MTGGEPPQRRGPGATTEDALALVHRTLLGEVLESSSILVFVADEEMRYVAVSDGVCRVLGYSREEILKLRVSDVAYEPTAPAEYAEMVDTGERSGTAQLRTKSGETVAFQYFATETKVGVLAFFVAVGMVSPTA